MEQRPELSLWRDIPTAWDDTKVLSGEIGEHAVVARRKDGNWYVGGITNNNPGVLNIKLNFLKEDKKYDATIYTDSPEGDKVLIETKKNVNSKSELAFSLLPSGGFVIHLIEK
jgi:alpha-glucosidase